MTTTDRFAPRDRLRVVLPGDPHDGHIGRVGRTYADCDDMVHVLDFADGTQGHYTVAELLALTIHPVPRRPIRPPCPPRPLVRSGYGKPTPSEQD